jgi:hypothetical protein
MLCCVVHCRRYKQTLDLQVQQRQHEKWERLFIERVQYKKVVAVSAGKLHAYRVQTGCASISLSPLHNHRYVLEPSLFVQPSA